MDESLIKIGMNIELDYGEGTIIHKAMKDGRLYINVAFGEDNLEEASFKIYSVDFDEEGATFNEVKDLSLSQELATNWLADALVEWNNDREN